MGKPESHWCRPSVRPQLSGAEASVCPRPVPVQGCVASRPHQAGRGWRDEGPSARAMGRAGAGQAAMRGPQWRCPDRVWIFPGISQNCPWCAAMPRALSYSWGPPYACPPCFWGAEEEAEEDEGWPRRCSSCRWRAVSNTPILWFQRHQPLCFAMGSCREASLYVKIRETGLRAKSRLP